jgi:hypothetical protein
MELSPLAVPFRLAMLTRAVDKLEESFDADPFLFSGGKTITARNALAPLTTAVDSLDQTDSWFRSDGKTMVDLDRLVARVEEVLSRVRASRAQVARYGSPAPGTEVRACSRAPSR